MPFRIELSVLGSWRLRLDTRPATMCTRERRVLAFLALHDPSARCFVAGTLWPDSPERRALGSLRAAVWHIRRLDGGIVWGDRNDVGLGDEVATDIADLENCIRSAGTDPQSFWRAGRIATLAGDVLLPGWYDDWVQAERDRLGRERLAALQQLARYGLRTHQFPLAVQAAVLATELEPLNEDLIELLLTAQVAAGLAVDASRAFLRFERRLDAELGLNISPHLAAVARGLLEQPADAP